MAKSLSGFINLSTGGGLRTLAPIFQTVANAIEQATAAFKLFSNKGEEIGEKIGDFILYPFLWVGRKIQQAWDRTVDYLTQRLTPFAVYVQKIRDIIVHALAQNSPGTTTIIQDAWAFTVGFIKERVMSLPSVFKKVGQGIRDYITLNPYSFA